MNPSHSPRWTRHVLSTVLALGLLGYGVRTLPEAPSANIAPPDFIAVVYAAASTEPAR